MRPHRYDATSTDTPTVQASGFAFQRSRPALLLACGAALGALLAGWGVLRGGSGPRSGALPPGIVARVNGQLIRLEDYQRAVNGLAQDRRSGVDAEQRKLVLDRLIDDELLLQRALDLGLAHDDLRVRRSLTAAVIESVASEQEGVTPDDNELRAFYESDREFFTSPGQLRVRQIWLRAANAADATVAQQRAQQAVERLRQGEDFATVKAAVGDKELAPIPDALLPVSKLGDYLGPSAIRTAMTLAPGEVGEPVRSNTGYHVLQVVERNAAEPAPFDSVKSQVLAEYRRRAADKALRAYLEDLRRQADITVVGNLP